MSLRKLICGHPSAGAGSKLLLLCLVVGLTQAAAASVPCQPCIKRSNVTVYSFVAMRRTRSLGFNYDGVLVPERIPTVSSWEVLKRAQTAAAGIMDINLVAFKDFAHEDIWDRQMKYELDKKLTAMTGRGIDAMTLTINAEAEEAKEEIQRAHDLGIPIFSLNDNSKAFRDGTYHSLAHFGIDDEQGWDELGPQLKALAGDEDAPVARCILTGVDEIDVELDRYATTHHIENRRLQQLQAFCEAEGAVVQRVDTVQTEEFNEAKRDLVAARMASAFQTALDSGGKTIMFVVRDPWGYVREQLQVYRPRFSAASNSGTSLSVGTFELTTFSRRDVQTGLYDLLAYDSYFLQGFLSVMAATVYATTYMLALKGEIYQTGPFYLVKADTETAGFEEWFGRHQEGFPICDCPRPLSFKEAEVSSSACIPHGTCPNMAGGCKLPCADLRQVGINGALASMGPFWMSLRGGFASAFRDFRLSEPQVTMGAFDPFTSPPQTELFKNASAEGNGVIIVPLAHDADVVAEGQKHTPVVAVNQDIALDVLKGGKHAVAFVGQDDYAAGYAVGEYFARVKKRKHILTVGISNDFRFSVRRVNGARQAFIDRGLKVTSVIMGFGTDDDCKNIVVKTVLENPDIDATMTVWPHLYGITEAVTELNRTSAEMSVGVFDLSDIGLEFIQAGKIDILMDQQNWLQGYLSTAMLTLYQGTGEKLRDVMLVTNKVVTADLLNTDYLANHDCTKILWGEETSGIMNLPTSLSAPRSYPTCPIKAGCAPGFGGRFCDKCPPGTYSAIVENGQECTECPGGVICNERTGSGPPGHPSYVLAQARWAEDIAIGLLNTWITCPAGHFCPPGTVTPKGCPAGTAGVEEGVASRDACVQCPPGEYGDTAAMSACEVCPPGQFSSAYSASSCQQCDLGTYQDQPGKSECLPCPQANSITLTRQSTSVDECVCERGFWLTGTTYEVPLKGTGDGAACSECQYGWDCEFKKTLFGQARVVPGFYTAEYNPSVSPYKCPGGEGACRGEVVDACAEGSEGVNCAKCKDGYYLSPEKTCHECEGSGGGVVVLVLIILFFVAICYYNMMPMDVDEAKNRQLYIRSLSVSATISLEVEFIQMLWIFGKVTAGWPNTVKEILSASGEAFDLSVLKVGCWADGDTSVVPLMTFGPLMIPLIMLVEFSLGSAIFAKSSRFRPNLLVVCNVGWSVFQSFFLIIFNNAVNTVFAADQHTNGEYTVRSFPHITMDSDEFGTIAPWGIVGLLLWCGGYVSAYTYVILHRHTWPEHSRKHDMALFVLKRFRRGLTMWGFVFILRRALLCLALTIFSIASHQLMFMLGVLVLSIVSQAFVTPTLSISAHYTDVIFMALSAMLLASGLMADAERADMRTMAEGHREEVTSWITALAYIGLFGAMAYTALKYYRLYSVNRHADKVKDRTWKLIRTHNDNVNACLRDEEAQKEYLDYVKYLDSTDRQYLEMVLSFENQQLESILNIKPAAAAGENMSKIVPT